MIYNFLKADGPHKALTITKALGLETKKEVNHNLYDMERKHLLHHDTNLDVWAVYRPGRPLLAAHTWTGQRGRAVTRNHNA